MFFTVRNIQGFVINIDDFCGDDVFFAQLLAELRPRYKLVFTSQTAGDYSRFGISNTDVFVAKSFLEYSMYQNVFRRAISKMGTVPSSTVFLCRNARFLRNAHELLLGTIVMMPQSISDSDKLLIFQEFPDFLLNTIAELKDCLNGSDVGFGGEYLSSPPGVFIFNPSQVKTCRFPSVPNTEHPDSPVYVAGRYFAANDPRHGLHPLSTRIVRSKKTPQAQAQCFSDLFMRGSWWASSGNFDLITRVPARPGDIDRLLIYMNAMTSSPTFASANLNANQLRPDVLQCIANYPKLKTLNFQQRKQAVHGAFQAHPYVMGRRVILLDDVQTTGATLNECISTLKIAGVQSVLPLVLGYHPYTLHTLGLTDDHELHCSACKSKLIGKCNKTTGVPFYACVDWKPNDGIVHSTQTFANGLQAKTTLMQPHLMQMDDELNSEGINF